MRRVERRELILRHRLSDGASSAMYGRLRPKPKSCDSRFCRLRAEQPRARRRAPATRATCSATSRSPHACAALGGRPSSARASRRSDRCAIRCTAGATPNTTPVASETATAKPTTAATATGSIGTRGAAERDGHDRSRAGVGHPEAGGAAGNRQQQALDQDCATSRHRGAPSATRTAVSCRRAMPCGEQQVRQVRARDQQDGGGNRRGAASAPAFESGR